MFAACVALALTAGADAALTQPADVSIFASVIDATGQPITDLTTADFAIREDETDREIVSARLATQPMNVALLIDTSTAAEVFVQEMRVGFRTFIQTVLAASPQSQLSLWEYGQAAVRIENFTSDADKLGRTAGRLFTKPRSASVLLEAHRTVLERRERRRVPLVIG